MTAKASQGHITKALAGAVMALDEGARSWRIARGAGVSGRAIP